MPLPEKIGRYEVKSELGRGGMATVYRAVDPNSGREVAVKVLPREMMHDPQFRERFEREIKMIASLEHPAIVPVYDVGDIDGQPYFVMRFMTGGSLSDLIEKGSIPIDETAKIIEKIAQGLAYAHRKGVIHRDLKPDNILFNDDGEPFISDFGVAKLSESSSNLTGSGVIGTPAYMSPEQAQGNEIDQRSDVYGLGVIVYQMLSGHQPYSADTPMGVVVKHITEPVPEILKVLPNLPEDVDAIIKTAMAKDKTQRYANTIELAKALNTVAFGTPGDITFHTMNGRTRLPSNSKPLSRGQTTGLAVGGVILLLAIVGVFLLRNQLFASSSPTSTTDAASTEVSETSTPVLVVVTATLPEATLASGPASAPACSANVSFPAPIGKETNSFCTQKIPYAYANMADHATFTILDSSTAGAKCRQEAIKNGEKVVSCTGPSFAVIDLEVCEPVELKPEELSQCSADSTYNAANQCCVQQPPQKASCKVIKIQLKGCGG
ncbi:MAG TPA: serine/threonine-protein kinase [Anaerolineales bacterium]|nr:serine/threonine-protein kinase [Anaerolineales bacterium]HNH26914.1 serine/threonine-protein kinase [Anaerolineales bacterium]